MTIWLQPDPTHPPTRTNARIDIELGGAEARRARCCVRILNVLQLGFENVTYTMGAGVLSVKFS